MAVVVTWSSPNDYSFRPLTILIAVGKKAGLSLTTVEHFLFVCLGFEILLHFSIASKALT